MAVSGPGRGGLFFAVQLAAGAPFLAAAPMEYLRASFNFGRVFTHKWSVSGRRATAACCRPATTACRPLPHAGHCRLPATAACRPLPHAGHCHMLLPTGDYCRLPATAALRLPPCVRHLFSFAGAWFPG